MSCVRFVSCLAVAGLCAASAALAVESNRSSAPSPPGRNATAEGLVQSALKAEAQADLARRRDLLSEALEADPNNPAAHWQLGQVFYGGKWVSIDEAAERGRTRQGFGRLSRDARTFRRQRRSPTGVGPLVPEERFDDSARAHATRLLEMQPDDAEALKILDLSWYQGMLLTPNEIALRKQHDEKAKAALRHWQPIALDIRRQIDSKDEKQSAAGWKALREIRDPSAIEALEAVFSKYRHDASLEVVKVVGGMETPAATDSLLRHALLSKWEDVRLAACQQLRGQSPVGYVPKMINALTVPAETRFEVVGDGDQVKFREIVERQNAAGKQQQVVETRVPLFIPNPNLAAIVNSAARETFAHAQSTARELRGTKRANRRQEEMNNEIYWVLEKATGQTLARNPNAWSGWWQTSNYMGIAPKPVSTHTYPQYVDVPYVPYIPPNIPLYAGGAIGTANAAQIAERVIPQPRCFALGTKVWLLTGPVAIETVQVGDRVLAQDPFSGELTYKPVLRTGRRPRQPAVDRPGR